MSFDPKNEAAEADPEYRIAYDVARCKVGCRLIQAALGGDVPHDIFYDYFGTEMWTVDATGCAVYAIRRSQLPLLAARTNRSFALKKISG